MNAPTIPEYASMDAARILPDLIIVSASQDLLPQQIIPFVLTWMNARQVECATMGNA